MAKPISIFGPAKDIDYCAREIVRLSESREPIVLYGENRGESSQREAILVSTHGKNVVVEKGPSPLKVMSVEPIEVMVMGLGIIHADSHGLKLPHWGTVNTGLDRFMERVLRISPLRLRLNGKTYEDRSPDSYEVKSLEVAHLGRNNYGLMEKIAISLYGNGPKVLPSH